MMLVMFNGRHGNMDKRNGYCDLERVVQTNENKYGTVTQSNWPRRSKNLQSVPQVEEVSIGFELNSDQKY